MSTARTATRGSSVPPGEVTIGRELGPVGRWMRVVAGLLALSYGVTGFVSATGAEIVQTVGSVAVLAVYYLLVHWLLGERLFARADPWFGTVIVLGSLGVFTAPFMPEPMHHAVGLYVGGALILTAAIRYGGCEVVALPTLLTGRRYVLYCPWNAVDATERPLHRLRIGPLSAAAIGLTAIVGVYFALGRDVLSRFELSNPVAPLWALSLLPVALLLARYARAAARDGEPAGRTEARMLGLGAAVLVLLALYFAELIPQGLVWPAVMLAGLLYAIARTIVVRRRAARGMGRTG